MQRRQCVILEGDAKWCRTTSKTLLEKFENSNIILLSADTDNDLLTITQKQAQQYLGKEFDAVIFDALVDFNPDSLGAIIGTIKQGGVLIIWLENSQNSLWIQRFKRVLKEFDEQNSNFTIVQQGQVLPQLNQWGQTRLISSNEIECVDKSIESDPIDSLYLTKDQQKAVEAVKRVVHGHRRRPLVLSADRGRGKSASLGIAAAQLLAEGKQTILVTAPSLAIADTVFEHARRLLTEAHSSTGLISLGEAEIRFIAPDVLIKSDLKADLVLVDEAAAIPTSMLEKLLQKYSRLVFATTLHGYEGTGRGFAIRFQKILDQQTPDWHSYRMETPIRWGEDDLLERFGFQALLLDASPVADDLISDAQTEQCQIELLDRKQLLTDEQSLRELFGLMVLAHYRTRPSDLQMMLDRDDITIYVVRYQGHIVASAWLVNEGELDGELSKAVYEGKRRLKGHLLPQSLLAHVGIDDAGSLRYQRIVRIAVHPAIQQRKIGQTLLKHCFQQAKDDRYDIMGTSFSMSVCLTDFWSKSAFEFARLGIHKDDVSGSHAAMMLRGISERGSSVVLAATQRFNQQWPHLLNSQFNELASDHVISISQLRSAIELKDVDMHEINAFANAQRSYESCQVTLWHWLSQQISSSTFLNLSKQQQSLCVELVLQQHPWKSLSFSGKSQVVNALRKAVSTLLDQ